MENFDRENIDELLEIRQIRQYFPPSKICAVQYWMANNLSNNIQNYNEATKQQQLKNGTEVETCI